MLTRSRLQIVRGVVYETDLTMAELPEDRYFKSRMFRWKKTSVMIGHEYCVMFYSNRNEEYLHLNMKEISLDVGRPVKFLEIQDGVTGGVYDYGRMVDVRKLGGASPHDANFFTKSGVGVTITWDGKIHICQNMDRSEMYEIAREVIAEIEK